MVPSPVVSSRVVTSPVVSSRVVTSRVVTSPVVTGEAPAAVTGNSEGSRAAAAGIAGAVSMIQPCSMGARACLQRSRCAWPQSRKS